MTINEISTVHLRQPRGLRTTTHTRTFRRALYNDLTTSSRRTHRSAGRVPACMWIRSAVTNTQITRALTTSSAAVTALKIQMRFIRSAPFRADVCAAACEGSACGALCKTQTRKNFARCIRFRLYTTNDFFYSSAQFDRSKRTWRTTRGNNNSLRLRGGGCCRIRKQGGLRGGR